MAKAAAPKLTFKPVTKARWDDFAALFASKGAPSYCWCMAWRQTKDELKDTTSPSRRRQMQSRIKAGTPVGLLGYADGSPVAWVSIAPRDTYRPLGGPEPEDGEKIWSLVCMFIPRVMRGTGIAHKLIAAAVSHARKKGATVVEAYPVEPDSPSYRYMGFIPAYEKAGFKEVGTAGSRRHVMRKAV